MTEKIPTPVFQVLKSGVQVTMKVSSRFKHRVDQGGYVYVCLPWINDEWHAFSVFEFPQDDNKRQIFIQNIGDWTNKLHTALQRNTSRPMWVQGPFTSAFHHAENYDNQILVATGIGITPILSAVLAYNKSRRVNIIWMVREEDLLTFYINYLNQSRVGWILVFYTGKTPLNPLFEEYWAESNVRITKGRPCLADLIPNIIYGAETRKICFENKNFFDSTSAAFNEALSCIDDMIHSCKTEKEAHEKAYNKFNSIGLQIPTSVNERISSLKNREPKLPMLPIHEEWKVVPEPEPSHESESESHVSFIDALVEFKSEKNKSLVKMKNDFEAWQSYAQASEYVAILGKEIIETWGILFCGGNKFVVKDLSDISERYGIDLHTESFYW